MKSAIAVLLGGKSPEREVSLISGAEIAKELSTAGYTVNEYDPANYAREIDLVNEIQMAKNDLVFNGLHGGSGENGELQALFSLAGLPMTGSGFSACTLTMDKYVSKLVVANEGIPVPDYLFLRENLLEDYQDTQDYETFIHKLGIPLVVKPNDAGSSVGISIVQRIQDLKPAISEAFRFGSTVLLEKFIQGRELTVTILDNKALPVVEIKPRTGFYDYKNKYQKGNTEYIAPAILTEHETQLIQLYAERAFRACGCSSYARIDFRYDGTSFYFLEVNTLPGMTPLSLSPMAAKAAGMSFGEFLQRIIAGAR